ncbi:sugar phosphate isomerase/epimerase family protein [Roseimaritima ulvae]|uniref:Inosose isomerase n=1 Tax=Roseimaritima ulvae TaxID=980254 RepID=A0A5B9QQC5_9BACT|nr:sugar phosphate isomerase/epimerase family protein [Roseimaritima ulvae]QEG41208.1 Inosose isomerase [Roseimaritima ulvae]
MKRRDFLSASALAGMTAATTTPGRSALAAEAGVTTLGRRGRVRTCLNTSTLRGQKLSVPEQIRITAEAGYDAIEPWMRDLQQYVESGGKLADLRKQLDDSGITVESAIGFAKWIVNDDRQRAEGLETARRDMAMLVEIGGKRIAAPPIGAHGKDGDRPDLPTIAERYRELLEVGAAAGVVPQLELWGFSPTLSRLGELAYVASEAGHPDACVLPDFYHIYKGGSNFAGLSMIEASRMHVFHINDYPADPPRQTISDKDRVYPGDGVCPLKPIIEQLVANGFDGYFSLELFNPQYWQQDAALVAKTGLEKMRRVLPVS